MKQIEGTVISNFLSPLDAELRPSCSGQELIPTKALLPSIDISMQLTLLTGSCALEIGIPFRVKVHRLCSDLFQVIMIPSDESKTAWAPAPVSRLISRPLLMECNSTSDALEHETTIPRSELMEQEVISLQWPLRTHTGPSIRCLWLLVETTFVEAWVLVEVVVGAGVEEGFIVGVFVPVLIGSGMLVE